MDKIKAVLFDYDGTLMDTNDLILGSWQHTFRQIEGRERPEAEIYATFGEILHDTMSRFFPGRDVEECVRIYRDYQVDIYEKLIEMFPGMEKLVRDLSAEGFLLALVTSRLPGTTMQGLEKFGLTDCFDVIVTCDDTDKHKPDPTPARIALERLGVAPGQALMVGDTSLDIQCGNRAGAWTVLVDWSMVCGPEKRAALAGDARPDFVARSAEDILRLARCADMAEAAAEGRTWR